MAAMKPKIVVVVNLDPAGLKKGTGQVLKDLKNINKAVDNSSSAMDRFKGSAAAMWRITGGIIMFNVVRHVTHAIRDLVGVVISFEEQMYNVNSVAQMSADELANLQDKVIDLALDPRIKDGPAQLAAGLYTITSSGYEAAEALVILEQAAMAATAGMTTSQVAADVLVSTLGAYNLGVDQAAFVTNQLFQIVNISKYTFEDLAASLDSVTPTAAALGIGMNEVGAAMAVFAKRGVDAQTATVQMNAILSSMLKPTDAMKEALAALGYETGQQMIQANGFVKTMQIWAAVVGEDADMASKLFGDVRALRGEMNLVNDGAVQLTKNLEEMNAAQEDGGAMSRALAEQMKSNAFQIAVFRKNLQTLAVLGFGLIASKLNGLLSGINEFVAGSIKAFRHFKDKGYSGFDAFRAAIKKTLQEMFGSDVVTPVLKFIDTMREAFLVLKKIILTLKPVVGGVLELFVKHLDILVPALAGAVIGIKAVTVAMSIASGVAAILSITLGPVTIAMIAMAAIGALLAVAWTKNWGDIQGKTKTAIKFIVPILYSLWDAIQPIIMAVVEMGQYLLDVAQGDIKPFGEELKKLPGWIQPIARVLGRVVKTIRVFVKVWQDKGFIAALKTMPVQLRAFGRAIGDLLGSVGLDKFGKLVKKMFFDFGSLFGHIVDLVDDIVHGRWKEVWEDLGNIFLDANKLFLNYLAMVPTLLSDVFDHIPWGTIGMILWNGYKRFLDWFGGVAIPWMAQTWWDITKGGYEAMLEFWDETISPWLGDVKDLLKGYFKDAKEWLFQEGNDILGGVWDGITYAWNWGIEWFSRLPERIVGVFSGARGWLYNAGRDIISGLWEGISSLGGWLYAQVKTFVWENTIGAANAAIGRKSPPKEFIYLGNDISKAVALGIQQTSHLASIASAHMLTGASTGSISVGGARSPLRQQLAVAGGGRSRSMTFMPGSVVVNASPGMNEESLAEKVALRIIREADNYEAGQA